MFLEHMKAMVIKKAEMTWVNIKNIVFENLNINNTNF